MLILFPAVFSLMATSPPRWYGYTRSNGNLQFWNCHFTVHYTQPEIIDLLKKDGIVLDTMPPVIRNSHYEEYDSLLQVINVHFYRLNSLVIDKDTLRDIEFSMRTYRHEKTKVYITGLNVRDDLSTTELLLKAEKYYEKLLLKAVKPHVKK